MLEVQTALSRIFPEYTYQSGENKAFTTVRSILIETNYGPKFVYEKYLSRTIREAIFSVSGF